MKYLNFFFFTLILTLISIFNIYSSAFYLKDDNFCVEFEKIVVDIDHGESQIEERVSNFDLYSDNRVKIPTIFFDRGSDKLLVVGQGFSGRKEQQVYKTKIFLDYDIVVFDYRWIRSYRFYLKPTTIIHPYQKILLEEKDEVLTVVNEIKSRKRYTDVIGLGECYSNFTFAMAQVESEQNGNPLFSKLIMDSAWLSLADFINEITLDPVLPLKPQKGGTPKIIKKVLKKKYIHKCLFNFVKLFVPKISSANYLSQIRMAPILFIHGTQDKMVPYETTFNRIWDTVVNTSKILFITPFEHSYNDKDKATYKFICDAFMSSSDLKEFKKLVRDIKI